LCLYAHPIFYQGDAGTHLRDTINRHEAIGTTPESTKVSARFATLLGVPENPLAKGRQSSRDWLALQGGHRFTIDNDGDVFSLWRFPKDGMIFDAHQLLFSFNLCVYLF
jgi:hypothetical protein